MNSLGYITQITNGLLILIGAGAVYRSIEVCVSALMDGEGLGEAVKKIKKKVAVVIICTGLATMVAIINRYYM